MPNPDDITHVGEEPDIAPGESDGDIYQATTGRRGGPPLYLWFATADHRGEQIFQLADIKRMEPPDSIEGPAYIHFFSGITVILHGYNLRRVLYRITIQRCTAIHQYRQGQRIEPGEPKVTRMQFKDMTAPPRGKPN